MRRTSWPSLAILLLLLETAAAAAVEGELTVSGFGGPAGTTLLGQPLALFTNDTGTLTALTLTAPRVVIHHYEREYANARVFVPQIAETRSAQYELTNVTVTLSGGDHRGLLGMYFRNGGGQVSFMATEALSLEAAFESVIGETYTPEEEPDPGRLAYGQSVQRPHIYGSGDGVVRYEGSFSAKIRGPDLVVTANENQTLVETGTTHHGPAPVTTQTNEEWVFLEVPQGTFVLEGAKSIELAAAAAQISWSGDATLHVIDGFLRSGTATYQGSGGSRVTGTFNGVATPHGTSTKEAVLALNLQGDLVSTSLQARGTATAPAPEGAGGSWLLVALTVVGAGGGAAAVVALRRRRLRPAFALEECVQRAGIAAENEEFLEALRWTDRAVAQAPRSARLHADRAFFLTRLERMDEALEAYAAASDLSPDGEAALGAARLLVTHGRPPEEARPWIELALARSPELVLEIDESFAPLREHAWLRKAQSRALARLEGDPNR